MKEVGKHSVARIVALSRNLSRYAPYRAVDHAHIPRPSLFKQKALLKAGLLTPTSKVQLNGEFLLMSSESTHVLSSLNSRPCC